MVSGFLTVHSPPMRHIPGRKELCYFIMNITEDQLCEDMLKSANINVYKTELMRYCTDSVLVPNQWGDSVSQKELVSSNISVRLPSFLVECLALGLEVLLASDSRCCNDEDVAVTTKRKTPTSFRHLTHGNSPVLLVIPITKDR